MLDEIRNELASRDIEVTFSAEVAEWLVRHVPPGQSARPMRAVLRQHVEDPLSLELLRGGSEEPIVVTVEDDELVFARPVPVV
jgi:ATP-dependent Clp protease ATP-binding subunit ClpC